MNAPINIFRRLLAVVLFTIGLTSSPSLVRAAIQAQFYVDPVNGQDGTNNGLTPSAAFRTIGRAKGAVAQINGSMTGDIIVNLMNGTFYLPGTLMFNYYDSGTNGYNVVYQAYPGAKPVVSGGEDISTGWTFDSANNRYYKTVTGSFRQLYVGGQWAIRARSPNLTDDRTGGGYYKANEPGNPYPPFVVSTADVGSWAVGGELVWNSHWRQSRRRISAYSANGATATLTLDPNQAGTDMGLTSERQYPVYYYIEDSLSALDAPGEWYHDTSISRLYYKPRPGETMGSVQIIVPRITRLFQIEGTSESVRVHNIQFRGITFSHDNWTAPSQYGYVAGQAGHLLQTTAGTIDAQDARFSPASAMITINNAEGIVIERNDFTLGGSWGIMEFGAASGGSQLNTYNGNTFTKLASGAIALGNQSGSNLQWASAIPTGTAWNDDVQNNVVDGVACYYRDAVGILALRTRNVAIEHNVVRNLPYTGISIGWQWNNSATQNANNNTVKYNRIYNCMQVLDDGGGIYNLGRAQSGVGDNVIDSNYIFAILPSAYYGGYDAAGIFLDQGSEDIDVLWNVGQNATGFTKAISTMGVSSNDGFYNRWRGLLGTTSGYQNWSSSYNLDRSSTTWNADEVAVIRSAGLETSFGDMDPNPPAAARWRFNQEPAELTDTSLNGHNVALYGGASYNTSDKKEGAASLSLNGSSQYARGTVATTATGNVTMTAWVKWNGGAGAQIVCYHGYAAGRGFGMFLDSGTFKVLCGGVGYVISSTTLSTGQWTHLAAVNRAGTWKLYVNGSEVTVSSGATTVPVAAQITDYTTIGWNGSTQYFNGLIDDVRVYNGPLSSSAVAAIGSTTGWERDEAQWGFNIGLNSAGDGSDGSGQGHTALLYGTPTFDTSDFKEGGACLSLNGTSQYAQASLASTATKDVVMSAWVKWNGGAGVQFVMHNGGSGSSGYGMYLDGGVFKVLCGGVGYVVSSYTVPTGQWTHLMAANADGVWALYANGTPVPITSGSTTVPNRPAGFTTIGKDNGTSYFNGRIDHARIYTTK